MEGAILMTFKEKIRAMLNLNRKEEIQMTAKEKVLAMLSGEQPVSVINGWEAFEFMMNPVTLAVSPLWPGHTVQDAWGVHMSWPEGQPGAMPLEGDKVVCPDIENWKEVLHKPDVASMSFDWGPFLGQQEAARAQGKLSLTMVPVGNFELLRNLMGFENCLMNLLEEPEMIQEIVDMIVDYRMECFEQICENLHPDILFIHDDWGSKKSMFMSPDTWREIFKPGYKKLFGYLHDQGVIVMHHADSYLEPIIADMEEIGIDIWQGVLPQNDIVKIQSQLKHMILFGGIDAAKTDHPTATEEEVRAEVRHVCETYIPGGHFIPTITAGGPTSINAHIDPIITDEIDRFSKEFSA